MLDSTFHGRLEFGFPKQKKKRKAQIHNGARKRKPCKPFSLPAWLCRASRHMAPREPTCPSEQLKRKKWEKRSTGIAVIVSRDREGPNAAKLSRTHVAVSPFPSLFSLAVFVLFLASFLFRTPSFGCSLFITSGRSKAHFLLRQCEVEARARTHRHTQTLSHPQT